MSAPWRTLSAYGEAEIIIQKSRFIGQATPVSSEEEALAFLRGVRAKYRDATHNCYAYTIGQNMGIMRYSDDGEPGGTAGLPMMEVIKKRQVCNCCVVVTRYFGGILLGAGGLVRAYTQGTGAGLNAAGIVLMEPTHRYLCEVAYGQWDRVRHELAAMPVQVLEPVFTTAVSFTLLVRSADAPAAEAALARLTDGQAECMLEGEEDLAWPLPETPSDVTAQPSAG